jgi:hypothetical protein
VCECPDMHAHAFAYIHTYIYSCAHTCLKLVSINVMVFSHEVRQVHGTSAAPEAVCAEGEGRECKGREKEVPDIMYATEFGFLSSSSPCANQHL